MLLSGILIIGGTLALALLGFAVVHRLAPAPARAPYNDVTGFVYAAVSVVYAIVVAYVVIVVSEQFDAARSDVQLEAVAADNIYHGVDQFPEPMRSRVQSAVKAYVETTIDEEWPLLADNQVSPKAEALAEDVRDTLRQLPADNPRQQVMLGHVLTDYEHLLAERRLRIFQGQEGVHPLLWALLVGGGALTIGFTYLFGLEDARVHLLLIAGLALLIGGMLFMVQQVEHPFAGQLHVVPEPLQRVLETFTS